MFTDDVSYTPAISPYTGEVATEHPSFLPCPDMAGMAKEPLDDNQCQRGLYLLEQLRKKHGLRRRTQPEPKEVLEPKRGWREKLRVSANQLPNRTVAKK